MPYGSAILFGRTWNKSNEYTNIRLTLMQSEYEVLTTCNKKRLAKMKKLHIK